MIPHAPGSFNKLSLVLLFTTKTAEPQRRVSDQHASRFWPYFGITKIWNKEDLELVFFLSCI